MDAVKYLKAKNRMTNSCMNSCSRCPLEDEKHSCGLLQNENPEQAVEIVEKWDKEHPVKTYFSVLLEKLPNVSLNKYGVPSTCPDTLFKNAKYDLCSCSKVCIDCWNREYKEEI